MTDRNTTRFLAGQTAATATIIELLIKKGLVSRQEVTAELYNLLILHDKEKQHEAMAAPIKHLLSIIER